MTAIQIQKRKGRSQQLKTLRLSEGQFAVESSQGKIMYLVSVDEEGQGTCTCADYMRNIRIDNHFRCKHILAVLDCEGLYEDAEILQKKMPKIDSRFIKNISGRDFCLYAGLLDYAHQKGLLKLQCEIVQLPNKDNEHEAICKAVAETKNGEVYEDIGDANSKNTNKMISAHIIRMASTRAKARCLRDLCNIGMTCLEELGDLDEVIGSEPVDNQNRRLKVVARKQTNTTENRSEAKDAKTDTKTDVKEAVKPDLKSEIKQEVKPDNPDPLDMGKPSEMSKPITKETVKPLSKDNGRGNNKFADNNNTDKSNDNSKAHGSTSNSANDNSRISEAQKRATVNLARRRGISPTELDAMITNTFGVAIDDMTIQQASQFIRELQSAA